jgi:hypothetical protein
LLPNYGDNFRSAMKNAESVFIAQMSVNDGSGGENGNPMDFYNGTFGGPATCCYGWYQPTFDLIDAYQTDAVTGLPLLDDYQNTPLPHDQGLTSTDPFTPYTGTLDSRLDHSVGTRGISIALRSDGSAVSHSIPCYFIGHPRNGLKIQKISSNSDFFQIRFSLRQIQCKSGNFVQ